VECRGRTKDGLIYWEIFENFKAIVTMQPLPPPRIQLVMPDFEQQLEDGFVMPDP
jgi:hypothetical protein